MELWDLYDKDRNRTGLTHIRGNPMPKGYFHLVSIVWIYNGKGELLISQRHPSKPFGLKWECTGGSVIAGEDTLLGAVREAYEELGLTLRLEDGILINSERREDYHDFIDEWLFYSDAPIESLTLQPSEVINTKWASLSEVENLFSCEEFSTLNRRYRQVFSLIDDILKGNPPRMAVKDRMTNADYVKQK